MAILTRLEALNDLIHSAVEKGANSVEKIHQSIAAMPLEELERRGLLTGLAGTVKKDQAATIGAVYDAIRFINEEVGVLAAGLLNVLGKEEAAAPEVDKAAAAKADDVA